MQKKKKKNPNECLKYEGLKSDGEVWMCAVIILLNSAFITKVDHTNSDNIVDNAKRNKNLA